jgi:hypothetical protein
MSGVLSLLADAVLVLHLVFILFVVFGGLLVLRWPRLAWLHLPAVGWASYLELSGAICPLTPLENALRAAAGGMVYSGGFIERYLMAVIYPPGLTRKIQIGLGVAVLGLTALVYALVVMRRWRGPPGAG